MIGVHFHGRLGNQLFQYAFALNESKRLKTDFFMSEKYSPMIIKKYFELTGYSYYSSKLKGLFFRNRGSVELENSKTYAENFKLLGRDECTYKGFFQSELYFKGIREELLKVFAIKEKFKVDVRKVLGIENRKPLFVLHVRRTDYLNHGDESMGGKDLSLPVDYYYTCLKAVGDLEKYNVVFVTDDADFVKKHFDAYQPLISSNKEMMVDFQIIMAADIVAVANSSFSWWGAYLNVNCKRIFAPKYWLGFLIKKEYPKDIVPSNWEQIEMN